MLPNSPSMDEMSTTADPGPAGGTARCSCRLIITAGPQVDVEGGVPDCVVDVVDRHGPGHPGGMDEPAERPEGRLGLGHRRRRSAAVSATSTTDQSATTPSVPAQRGAVSSAPAASMSQMATGRPTSARASAVARPMPDPPPVTRTPVPGSTRGGRGASRLGCVWRHGGAPAVCQTTGRHPPSGRPAGVRRPTQVRRPARGWQAGMDLRPQRVGLVPVRQHRVGEPPVGRRWPGRPRPPPARPRGCSSRRPGTRGSGRSARRSRGPPRAG